MENKILERKCQAFCEENEYDYEEVKICKWEDWVPSQEDIPSLVESIKYWMSVRPPGDAEEWSSLQCKLYFEAVKKEKICVELLGRVPDMLEIATQQVNKESRKLIRRKYYRMLKNKSRHAKTDN